MDNWYNSMPGGTHYTGRCPICGDENGSCSNGLCDECLSEQPRACPTCGCHYPADGFGSNGQCMVCDEMDITETVNKPSLIDRIKFGMECVDNKVFNV